MPQAPTALVDPASNAPVTDAAGNHFYEVGVKVENKTGHRIPAGYPNGRRFWIALKVTDGTTTLYESGHYAQTSAILFTDSTMAGFNRALGPEIDATVENAVMVYQQVTGTSRDSAGTAIFPNPTMSRSSKSGGTSCRWC